MHQFGTYSSGDYLKAQIIEQIFEVELAKTEIENVKSKFEVFYWHFFNLRGMNLFSNFLANICNTDISENLLMDTDSLILALTENDLYRWIREEKRQELNFLQSLKF